MNKTGNGLLVATESNSPLNTTSFSYRRKTGQQVF